MTENTQRTIEVVARMMQEALEAGKAELVEQYKKAIAELMTGKYD